MIKCTFENGGYASLRHVVVDSLVLKGREILLARRIKKFIEGGKWSLISGFVDRDETVKEAALREISEETGWVVKNIKLLRIVDRPDRPNEDRQNISFVYYCQAVKKTGEADQESTQQKWFKLNELPSRERLAFDTFENGEFYLKGK